MTRWIAFLRAINVGGHTVKMDRLRALFEALELGGVATFIASGNVIFTAERGDAAELERRIEAHLAGALGYEVTTFLRTAGEVAAIAEARPFPEGEMHADGRSLFVAFLKQEPEAAAKQRVLACRTETDDFRFDGRELYWLRHGRSSDSDFSGAVLERAIGAPATLRNLNTVRRLAAKYAD